MGKQPVKTVTQLDPWGLESSPLETQCADLAARNAELVGLLRDLIPNLAPDKYAAVEKRLCELGGG